MNTGYDVLLWKEINGQIEITNMAEYDLQKDDFIFPDEEKKTDFFNLKVFGTHALSLSNSGV